MVLRNLVVSHLFLYLDMTYTRTRISFQNLFQDEDDDDDDDDDEFQGGTAFPEGSRRRG